MAKFLSLAFKKILPLWTKTNYIENSGPRSYFSRYLDLKETEGGQRKGTVKIYLSQLFVGGIFFLYFAFVIHSCSKLFFRSFLDFLNKYMIVIPLICTFLGHKTQTHVMRKCV
jgi:hypothetical protein